MGDFGRRFSLLNQNLTITMPTKKVKKAYLNCINETPPGSPPPGTSTPNYHLNIQTYNEQMQTRKLKEANLVTPETSPEHEDEVDTYCRGKTTLLYHGASPVEFDWNWSPEPRTISPLTSDSEKLSSEDEDQAAIIHSFFPSIFGSNKDEEEEEPAMPDMMEDACVSESPLSDLIEDACMSELMWDNSGANMWNTSNISETDEWDSSASSSGCKRSPPLLFGSQSPFLSAASKSDSKCPDSPVLVPSMTAAAWDLEALHASSPPPGQMIGNFSGWETASPFEFDLHGLSTTLGDHLPQEAEQTQQQTPSPVIEQCVSSGKMKRLRPMKKAKRSKMSRRQIDVSSSLSDELLRKYSQSSPDTSAHLLIASTSKSSRLAGGPDVRIHGFLNNELPTDHNSYCAPAKTPTPAPVRKFQQSTEGAIVVVKEANGKLNTTVAGPCPTEFDAPSRILAHVEQQRKRKATFVKPTGTARISKATQAKRGRHIPNAEEAALLAKREKHKLSERQRRYKSAQGILQAQNYIVQTRGKDYFVNKTSNGKTNKVKKISKQSTLDTCKKLILELQASPPSLLCELCERTSIVVSKYNQLCAERRQFEADLGRTAASEVFSGEFDVLASQLVTLKKRLQLFQSRCGQRFSATN